MIRTVKRLLWPMLRAARLDGVYSLATASPAATDGWLRSYREGRSVDREGRPLPWLTYPAIEFLSRRVRPGMRVFEYGSGASTLWWAERVASVHAVEHDREWFRRSSHGLPPNAQVQHVALAPGEAYVRRILELDLKFDVVVIDGRRRAACAGVATSALSDGGVIVFDNTDRAHYQGAIQALERQGFRRIEFVGMAPIAPVKTETSIFYRPGNVLGI